jgi:pyridoxamine 5'-phosphate oxidase-like protein
MKLDPRGSTVLGVDECRRLLTSAAASSGTGRLAMNGAQSPYVIPVNFTVAGGGIIVRLGTGWAAFHLNGVPVTFETDQVAQTRHSAWSVVVEGVARELPYDEVARLGVNLPTPIVTVPGVRVFEIMPFKVMGRAVEPDLRRERRDRATGTLAPSEEQSKALHLGPEATEELTSLLRSVLGDLSSEIADTDNAPYRRALLERRRVIEEIAGQLTAADATPIRLRSARATFDKEV